MFIGCGRHTEKIKPVESSISESVYASGTVKSKDQYDAFATVTGVIEQVYVSEGDTVDAGTPILSVSGEAQRLCRENAELAAQFADFNNNQGKLNEARIAIDLAKNKLKNDSALYFRQKALWQQQVGTKVDLEQRQLAYEGSQNAYYNAQVTYNDLKRQLEFSSSQSKKNLMISNKQASDYVLKSDIKGRVYSLLKEKGEMVGPQTPLAVIGDAHTFLLQMQVDEYDILKVRTGQQVLITMDSYKGQVFEASITKIYPMMNERSKSFLVEAVFTKGPEVLYPNVTFEANIVIRKKDKALLVPRNYLLHDSVLVKASGDHVTVKTGLMDYKYVEILSGISLSDELIMPKE